MGRDATKAAGNPWYEARINAAKYNERLYSREGAAEMLGMSVSSLAELERLRKQVRCMADNSKHEAVIQ